MTTYNIVKVARHHLHHELCDVATFDPNKLCFGSIETRSIPGSTLKFQKIPLYCEFEPEKYSPVYFSTPADCYSYGIQEQNNVTTGMLDGYSIAICVYNPNNHNPAEVEFMTMFNNLVEHCKGYLTSPQGEDDIGIPLARHQLEKIAAPMFYKTIDNGKKGKKVLDPSKGPVFYPKLLTQRDRETGTFKLQTYFSESDGRDTTGSALDLYRTHMRVQAIIMVDSIYVGSNNVIRLQFKVTEVKVTPLANNLTRFLLPSAPTTSGAVAAEPTEPTGPTRSPVAHGELQTEEWPTIETHSPAAASRFAALDQDCGE